MNEVFDKMRQPFPITSVCRADVAQQFDNKDFAESLTDEEMGWIARKMADDYCEQLFWDSLQSFCDWVKMRRKK